MVRFLKNNGIVATKGDTIKMPIIVTNNDGTVYHVKDEDVINFGLKKEYTDAECLIEKTIDNEELILVLSHDDTKKLEVGVGYKYDIQILRNEDEVHTFISGILTVVNEVYDKDEEDKENDGGDDGDGNNNQQDPLDPSIPGGDGNTDPSDPPSDPSGDGTTP